MCKNIIMEETLKLKDMEKRTGEALPAPSYLFTRRYGRNLETDFEDLMRAGGYQEGFVFRVEEGERGNLVDRFQMEVKAHTQLGRRLQGLVLVDMRSGLEEIERSAWKSLLIYLKEQEPDIHCIFSMDENQESEEMRQMLEQYFFIRVVDGEAYGAVEQFGIIEEAFKRFDFTLDKKAVKVFTAALERRTWEVDDHVEHRLCSLVKNAVYDRLLDEDGLADANSRVIGELDAEKMMKSLENRNEKRKTIGFCIGGLENE